MASALPNACIQIVWNFEDPGRVSTRGPLVNLSVANEHIHDINRLIKVVKERFRGTRHGLPFKNMLKLLTTHIVLTMLNMIQLFSTKGGTSYSLSPKSIMSGKTID